jgi:hypothetical protein
MRILSVITFFLIASSAQAQGLILLPPEEFDRPFDGRIVIQEARDQDEVRKLCPNIVFTIGALGCAHLIPSIRLCAIVKVSDEQIRAAGHDPEIFMRHEIGHCNSWPAHHPGAR